MRDVVITGQAGPIVGVVEVTAEHLTGWRCCVICGWLGTKRVMDTTEEAFSAAAKMVAEQSEHIQNRHPEMAENVIMDAGASAFAPVEIGRC